MCLAHVGRRVFASLWSLASKWGLGCFHIYMGLFILLGIFETIWLCVNFSLVVALGLDCVIVVVSVN